MRAWLSGWWCAARRLLVMIKFSHTVFAMPFGLAALVLASPGGMPPVRVLCWSLVAMVAARSAAMAFNRLADHRFDALNPRTSTRALPAGLLSRGTVWIFVAVSLALFFLATAMLNTLCLTLAPLVVILLLGYSFMKRVSWATHVVLGLCLGLAPCGAWVAVKGMIDPSAWTAVLLGGAVVSWVAGFDIIYSCQDVTFDRSVGLHSLPARFGIGPALFLSAALHGLTVASLVLLALVTPLGGWYLAGVGVLTGVLIMEHALVRPGDLSRAGVAFFTVNGWVGIVFLIGVVLDRVRGG